MADYLADYKAPDRLVLLADLPQTAMMKVDKVELARQAAATSDDRDSTLKTTAKTADMTETSTN